MSNDTPHSAVMGRPTIYSDELAQSICEKLMVGMSLRKICAIDGMPAMSTVMQWLSSGNQDFMEQYAHARTIQAEYLLDESLDIADATIAETAEVAKSKLQIDTRKWMIEKLAPKKYGAKMEVDNKSSDGSMATKPTVIRLVAPNMGEGDE